MDDRGVDNTDALGAAMVAEGVVVEANENVDLAGLGADDEGAVKENLGLGADVSEGAGFEANAIFANGFRFGPATSPTLLDAAGCARVVEAKGLPDRDAGVVEGVGGLSRGGVGAVAPEPAPLRFVTLRIRRFFITSWLARVIPCPGSGASANRSSSPAS